MRLQIEFTVSMQILSRKTLSYLGRRSRDSTETQQRKFSSLENFGFRKKFQRMSLNNKNVMQENIVEFDHYYKLLLPR